MSELFDLRIHRASGLVGAREIACAHEELPRDFVSGEAKSYSGRARPIQRAGSPPGHRAICGRPVGLSECLKSPGVFDNRCDFSSVSDNPGIGQEPFLVLVAEGGNGVDFKAAEGLPGSEASF